VLWLELCCSLHIIVDQAKASGLAATKLSPKAKHEDRLCIAHVVHGSQLVLDFTLGHIGTAWVQHVHHELAPGQQPVRHELACPDSAGLVSHVCCFVLTAGLLLLRWIAF